ncbi:MAG: NfeD family protein [Acidimicrobiales bacterium]
MGSTVRQVFLAVSGDTVPGESGAVDAEGMAEGTPLGAVEPGPGDRLAGGRVRRLRPAGSDRAATGVGAARIVRVRGQSVPASCQGARRRMGVLRRRVRTGSRTETELSMLNGVPGMVGETAVVTKPVSVRHHPGSVRARGEDWYAVSLFPGTTIDVGKTVVVADVDRGLLVVYPSDDS